jgi:predicted metal-dependent hydrolase
LEQPDVVEQRYASGLELIAKGEFYEAHEVLEEAWRAAPREERDFFQGLVHVAVAWYQAGRGNEVGCERQLEKAARRLASFAPTHRELDVADLIAQVEAARGRFPSLPGLRIRARGGRYPTAAHRSSTRSRESPAHG